MSLFIGFLMQNYAPDLRCHGGEQVIVTHRVTGLRDLGHQVRTVFLSDEGPICSDDLNHWRPIAQPRPWRPFFHLFVEKPIRLLQTLFPVLPYLNLFDSLRFADAVRPLFAEADVILERFSLHGYGGVFLSQHLRVPRLLEIHGHPFDEIVHFTQPYRGLQHWAMRRLIRWNTDQAALVLPSGFGWERRWIETGLLRPNHARVVWPGVDLELFQRNVDKEPIRARYNIPSGPVVVFVGGFFGWQGLELLISAFGHVVREMPHAILLLIGEGPIENKLRCRVSELGCEDNVRFLGSLPHHEVAEILRISDIGVQLYEKRFEFVGMKLFEYMAAGLAVIVTAPDRRHELIADGENGLVITPGCEPELRVALLRLLEDNILREKLGATARKTIGENYTWRQRAQEIEQIAFQTVRRFKELR